MYGDYSTKCSWKRESKKREFQSYVQNSTALATADWEAPA